MPNYGLLIDYEYCSGCHSCEVACQEEHDFPIGMWGIRVFNDGPWQINDHKTNWNKIPVPTDLCDLCKDRVDQGRDPSCVHHCLCDVMRFGPVEELSKELGGKDKVVLWVPRPNETLDYRAGIDRTSVVDKVKNAKVDLEYSVADASGLDEADNASFKLALQREEQKLDDRQKIE